MTDPVFSVFYRTIRIATFQLSDPGPARIRTGLPPDDRGAGTARRLKTDRGVQPRGGRVCGL